MCNKKWSEGDADENLSRTELRLEAIGVYERAEAESDRAVH